MGANIAYRKGHTWVKIPQHVLADRCNEIAKAKSAVDLQFLDDKQSRRIFGNGLVYLTWIVRGRKLQPAIN